MSETASTSSTEPIDAWIEEPARDAFPHADVVPHAARPVFSKPPRIRIDRRGPNLQIRSARGFEITHVTFEVENLPAALDGLRLLHLTDLHARRYWDPAYDDLIAMTEKKPPDLILFTGDFVDNRFDHRAGLPTVQKLLNQLHSRLGTFAILGNHDGDLLGPALTSLKIHLLDHRQLRLHCGSATLELIGLAGVARQDLDDQFLKNISPRPSGAVRLMLGHFPDLILRTAFLEPDIYLSGHTHGGQICLPGRVPLMTHDPLPRQYCSGIHAGFGTWMITNRGFGFSSKIMARLFCPAEVIEIELRARE